MCRENYSSEEIYALMNFSDNYFVWVKHQFESCFQKIPQYRNQFFQTLPFSIQNNKIIGVSDVVFNPQFPFNEMVKFIEIDVGE